MDDDTFEDADELRALLWLALPFVQGDFSEFQDQEAVDAARAALLEAMALALA